MLLLLKYKYLYKDLVEGIAALYLSGDDLIGFSCLDNENQYRVVFKLVSENRVTSLNSKLEKMSIKQEDLENE